jgi:Flp pilus assembly protein TadD
MFRKRAGQATIFALLLGALAAPGPAAADWPFSSKPAAPDPAKTPAATPTGPQKATADQRAAAAHQPPLVRATFWQRELSIDPGDLEAGLGFASALRALGKFDEAADAADRLAGLYPKNEDALLESARAHIAAGHGFYAIAPLRAAEKLAPKDWRPVSLLAIALEQDERPEDARAAYDQALKLSPDNPAILTNLALFYAVRNDTARAEALLRTAVAQPSATAQERQNLALILGLEGKTAEAEKWMRQDLPPEAAAENLAYVSRASGAIGGAQGAPPAAPGPSPAAPTAPAAAASARTWGSLAGATPNSR